VDYGDPLAGFVITWLNKLASKFENVYVICQELGDTNGLPANVLVRSFGKEKGHGKLRQAYGLLAECFRQAKKTDGFFIHMHPVYAILAWLPAKLFHKKMVLWYTHKSVDLKLRIAHVLVDAVLTASPESFRLTSKKVKIFGHGIDLEKFSAKGGPASGGKVKDGKFRIISIGRISPVKDYETLIKAAEILRDSGVSDFIVEIYGKIGLPRHQGYYDDLVEFVKNAELEDYVKFQGELDYEYVDEAYREADLFVNLSQTGSIDKTVLESAASKTLVLTSNEAFAIPLSKIDPLLFFERDNPEDLAARIIKIKILPDEVRLKLQNELRSLVEENHNLDNLVKKIAEEFKA